MCFQGSVHRQDDMLISLELIGCVEVMISVEVSHHHLRRCDCSHDDVPYDDETIHGGCRFHGEPPMSLSQASVFSNMATYIYIDSDQSRNAPSFR